MKIESESIWKRNADGKSFIVNGVASAPGGEYVSVKQYDNDASTKFSPQTEGNIPMDQFLKEYVFQEQL